MEVIAGRLRALAVENGEVARFGQHTKCGGFGNATELMVIVRNEDGKLAAHWSGTMWQAKGMWVGLVSFHQRGGAVATASKAGGRDDIAEWIGTSWVEWHGQQVRN